MLKIASRIAFPIIIGGLFVLIAFVAFDYERMDMNFFIVSGLIVIYVFLFGFAIGQNFSSPVKELLSRATELSKGNLTTRVYTETKDEFGELARIFNKIATDLEESKLNAEKTEKSVDIKVKARTQALDETINALEQKIKNRTLELERIMSESEKAKEEKNRKESEISELKSEVAKLKEELLKHEKPA